jgi:hypothetical protein
MIDIGNIEDKKLPGYFAIHPNVVQNSGGWMLLKKGSF